MRKSTCRRSMKGRALAFRDKQNDNTATAVPLNIPQSTYQCICLRKLGGTAVANRKYHKAYGDNNMHKLYLRLYMKGCALTFQIKKIRVWKMFVLDWEAVN